MLGSNELNEVNLHANYKFSDVYVR